MNVLTLNQKDIDKLEKYKIDERISNKEATLYRYKSHDWQLDSDYLLKRLYITEKSVFANKLHTISMLNDYEKEIGIKSLVIPNQIVSLCGNIIGFTIEEVKNSKNLGIVLQDENVKMDDKIKYLNKIGDILNKVQYLSKYGLNFYFSDLHEYNFLIGENDEVFAVDLDSATFINNIALPAHYPYENPNLSSFGDKYKFNAYGIPYPSYNCDVLSFNMMVLDTLSQAQMSHAYLDEYYQYMNYLRDLGFGNDLINSFISVYNNCDNKICSNYFDQLAQGNLEKANYKEFKKEYKKCS